MTLTPADHRHRADQLRNAAALVYSPRAFNAIMRAIQDEQAQHGHPGPRHPLGHSLPRGPRHPSSRLRIRR